MIIIKGSQLRKGDGGFTLVELLVVVLIIGVLAAIGIPQYFKVVERSRAGEIQDNIGTIQSAEERYMARNGGYDTADFTQFDIVIPNMGNGAGGSGSGTFGSATANLGYTKDFAVTIEGGAGGGYDVVYVRTGNAPAHYGLYTITYGPCGNGTSCGSNGSGGNGNSLADINALVQ